MVTLFFEDTVRRLSDIFKVMRRGLMGIVITHQTISGALIDVHRRNLIVKRLKED